MTEELRREDGEAGTEGGRSPSAVPASGGVAGTHGLDGAIHQELIKDPPGKPESGPSPPGPDGGIAAQGGEEPTGRAPAEFLDDAPPPPRLGGRRRGRRLVKSTERPNGQLTPEERLLALDVWKRSGLPASEFSSLLGVSAHTLYQWRARFQSQGPAGLMDRERGGPRGSRLPELTRRAILLMKESHPEWGSERISDMLYRGPALPASPGAVLRVLHEAGYELEESPTRPHPEKQVRSFERSRPNQLWQSDLFTFLLKRQNRRLYLVAFLDDHSRFVVSYGLHATQSTALVIEVLRAAISSYQPPEEVLTDNGSQYVTWRGKSAFQRELERRGIRHIVSAPRHPQTLGKIERFWGSLWRECLERAVFLDLADAQKRIGLFIDYYNFQRPHRGLGGLVPADRFFGAAPEVLRTLKERVRQNAFELARDGLPRSPFYLTGSAGGRSFSVHAEGERVILRRGEGEREEVELVAPEGDGSSPPPPELPLSLTPCGSPEEGEASAVEEAELPPGVSPLDDLPSAAGLEGAEAMPKEEETGGAS